MSKFVQVPPPFRQFDNFPYPAHNRIPFEWWLYQNLISEEIKGDRLYLPIQWGAFFRSANYGEYKPLMNELQIYLNSLDREKKYFSICQWDTGILVDVSHLDIQVFSMSGPPVDYPLPLLCEPHPFKFGMGNKDIFCSFVGRLTHQLRQTVMDTVPRHIPARRYYVTDAPHTANQFCNILSRSKFSLALRGFGCTSFRLLESMQYGALPVYVSDEFLIPHNIPFEEYGVLIEAKDAFRIDDILSAIPEAEIKRKQERLPYIFENYFTYEANKRLILENLKP